jgi:hypothetical protein
MKPFPKWLGILMAVAGALTASASVIEGMFKAFTEKNWLALALGLSTLIASLSHSATGTGGVPAK